MATVRRSRSTKVRPGLQAAPVQSAVKVAYLRSKLEQQARPLDEPAN